MKITTRIYLDLIPPSTNSYFRQRWTGKFIQKYTTKESQMFREYVQNLLTEYKPTEELFEIEINYIFPDKRKHDIDNYCKILLDCMEGYIYKNDNQIVKLTLTKDYEKGKSSVLIIIKTID